MKKIVMMLTFGFAIATFSVEDASAQTTQVKKKTRTGWSNKKKGAAIGAGAGAATGAIVSKNDSKGALIGGAVGAGAGYMIGRRKDKRNPGRKTVSKTKVTTTQ